jgi:peptide/nickel transport system permease protein
MPVGATEILPGGGGFDVLEANEEIAARSPLQLFWRRLRKDRVAMVSLGFVAFLVIVAIAAPLIVSILGLPGPYIQNINLTDEFGSPLGPSAAHPFGVDQLGHDVMSRVIYGTRVSLEVGIVGTSIATVIGVSLGIVAGYYRGWVDTLLSRAVDVVLSIPVLLLGLGIGAACAVRGCLGGTISPGTSVIIFLIALVNWTYIFRIVRGLVLSLREREFVDAARALGASDARIMFREILPNLVAPVIVYTTLLIPTAIVFEATLSFLGMGVVPPTPTWGNMLSDSLQYYQVAWWFVLFPGLALLITTLAFNLLGDGVRDALDPRGSLRVRRRTRRLPGAP